MRACNAARLSVPVVVMAVIGASSRGWCSESLVFCLSLSGLTRGSILEPRFSLP